MKITLPKAARWLARTPHIVLALFACGALLVLTGTTLLVAAQQNNQDIKQASARDIPPAKTVAQTASNAANTDPAPAPAQATPQPATSNTTQAAPKPPVKKPAIAPTPVPTIPPQITMTASTYSQPVPSPGVVFFTSSGFRAGSYMLVVSPYSIQNGQGKEFVSTTVSLNPPYSGQTGEAGNATLPFLLIPTSQSGDQYTVKLCENKGGSCGITSNVIRLTLRGVNFTDYGAGYSVEFHR